MASEKRRSMAAIETIDFEDEELDQFGAAQIQHLPQTQLLDGYACIQCSRCQDACPAYETSFVGRTSVLTPTTLYAGIAI